jgi:hypothetical protein
MRRLFMTCAGTVALFMTASFAPPAAQAMNIAAPAGLSKAMHEANLAQDVAYICRGGWLWRRCGWVPGPYLGYGYYRPSYAYSYYRPYRPYYAYGYYRPYRVWAWSYRRWWW